jgi:hypothetical protein
MCPIVRGPGVDWRIVFGCSSDESILANSPVDINDMAWRTFHRGDRGLPVSRLEHAAHAHRRFEKVNGVDFVATADECGGMAFGSKERLVDSVRCIARCCSSK